MKLGIMQMRNNIIILCLVLSGIIILDSLNAGNAIAMFLLAGVVPGTNIIMSGSTMLELFALLTGFTLSRITLYCIRNIEVPKLVATKSRRNRVAAARI